MVYLTGDPHGRWDEVLSIAPLLQPGDKLILGGDNNYGMTPGQEKNFDQMERELPIEILLLDGNHENFDALNALPVETWCGGKVHRIRKNIVHLMRGEIFTIEGHTIFAFGGGHSPDKARQQALGHWWPQELPSEEEYQNAEANLRALREQNRPLDFIVTHIAPSAALEYLSIVKRDIRNEVSEDWDLVDFLNRISYEWKTTKKWYFGHYHVDAALYGSYFALLHAVRELESGRIVGWKSQPIDP